MIEGGRKYLNWIYFVTAMTGLQGSSQYREEAGSVSTSKHSWLLCTTSKATRGVRGRGEPPFVAWTLHVWGTLTVKRAYPGYLGVSFLATISMWLLQTGRLVQEQCNWD